MPLRAVLDELPAGYELVRGRRGWLACERDSAARLRSAGFGPEGGERLEQSDLSGRRPLDAIESGDERWIVRRFHHGGLLRWLGESPFLQPARPFRELVLASRLRAAGFATPRVIAARASRAPFVGWRLALVTARVEEAVEGAVVLERLRRGEVGLDERRRFLGTAGELIGRMHAAGFLHADLTPRNLLFTPDLGSAWILDLDRGRMLGRLDDSARRRNLRRLFRSVRRREARARAFLPRTDYLRFLRAYGRGLGCGDWRTDWRAIWRGDRLFAPVHRLGWLLETWFGSGPAARDGAAVPR